MDLRIQRSVVSNLRTRPQAVEVGPFVAGFDAGTDSPFVNYATPQPGAAITAADVRALIEAFEQAGRKPRLEYVTSSSPGLESLLLAAGFTVEARQEYLICTPQTLNAPPVPSDVILAEARTDPDRADLAAATNEAFGAPAEASDGDVARIRRTQDGGGIALLARAADGERAGGGQAMTPQDRLSEIGGIGVREPFRRRGLGGAITAEIARLLFARGVEIAWLEAGGEDSWRVYERVGFAPAGRRLYISR
ncbi:putative GCN5-related N-acetyltransferase [Actinoplanes missouriensis 431]|uniref:Putative GCN5-related N-acetyltransferase n=1 Tax=Actinoplanes missouriensis (strain ATCC 14538 / DSM 43046 / CBS 188.64 / JCM 3121 / NBRC 102363 / NCIMB 12654 / NRRL B-3342 / UNCC 431) TaxID=512565 RepID=I0HEF7_ACTM4|nr:GNAT family N-acetyltransferase [Actinoplanes missouriensis]BAL91394.1 putative GCN5-related N-acetyltransferase [Actinoplanes missouriensis 431]